MRDPDMVHRAERAATALERAWGHWRVMHGFGADPLAPVSSYVGYSLEEPWGQPRVVFGVAAEEAERLAALLDGHDCVGPVHAEVTSRPDWRYVPVSDRPIATRRPPEDQPRVPAQAARPGSDLFASGGQDSQGPAGATDSAMNAASVRAARVKSKPVTAAPVSRASMRASGDVAASGKAAQLVAAEPGKVTAVAEAAESGGRAGTAGDVSAGASATVESATVESATVESASTPRNGAASNGAARNGVARSGAASNDVASNAAPGGNAGPSGIVAGGSIAATGGATNGMEGTASDSTTGGAGSGSTTSGVGSDSAVGDSAASGSAANGGTASDSTLGRTTASEVLGEVSTTDDGGANGDTRQSRGRGGPAGAGSKGEGPMPAPPGTVAFRRRPDQPTDLSADPALLADSDSYDVMPTQGPGYRGPRYQGFPPQYQSGPDPGLPQPDYASYAYEDDDFAADAVQPEPSRPRPVSKRGRSRRSGPGAHEVNPWDRQAGRAATDHAV
jgi:hypothetical protein